MPILPFGRTPVKRSPDPAKVARVEWAEITIRRIGHAALIVWFWLGRWAGKAPSGKAEACFPGHRTIARKAGMSLSTVKRALAVLAAAGWLEIRKKGRGRRYVLNPAIPSTRAWWASVALRGEQAPE